MAVLSNFQGSFGGLTFGPGTDIQVVEWDGLRELPGIRSGDQARPRGDGSFAGLNYLGERVITLKLSVTVTQTPFETVIANLASVFQSTSSPSALQPFFFMLPGWTTPRQVTARPTKASIPVDLEYNFHKASPLVELTCPDPLIYDVQPQTALTGLPAPSAGLTFPVAFPVTFGASAGGSLAVTNTGNYPTAPVFTITGPCTNPSITLSSGGSMSFNLTLSSSDTLVVDMAARTVLLNGVSRANTIVSGSSWFAFPVGAATVFVGSRDSAAVAAQFKVTWRNAWSWC